MGIEPMPSAWKAEVLPLNYTRRWQPQPASSDPLGRSILSNSWELHCFTDEPSRFGGGGRIRTYEGVSRQIYSLLPLAAWVPLRENEPRILISTAGGVNAPDR